jgi:hypothetical protein
MKYKNFVEKFPLAINMESLSYGMFSSMAERVYCIPNNVDNSVQFNQRYV